MSRREWVDMSSHWADLLLLVGRLSIMIVAAYQAGWSSCSRSLLKWRKPSSSAWMIKRSENVNFGGLWLEGHGLSEGSETLGLSSRVRRAAPSTQTQTDEPVEASYGLAKTATLTMKQRRAREHEPELVLGVDDDERRERREE